jgi:uncharacterized RDD family membrane protein YckC
MVSALNLIGSNSELQSHWLRRIIAAFIDGVIMMILGIIISVIIAIIAFIIPGGYLLTALISGTIWLLYSWILEATKGATIGKQLLNLRVVSLEGPMNFTNALVRNISKIYWLFFLIDWIVGFVTDGDPRQRWFDRFSNTTVVRTDVPEIIPGAYQPGGGIVPAPMPPMQPQPQYGAPPQYGAQPGQPQQYQQSQGQPYQEQHLEQPATVEKKAVPVTESTTPETYTRSDLVALKKDELVNIAKDKGLKTSGTKRDLIDRILGEGD